MAGRRRTGKNKINLTEFERKYDKKGEKNTEKNVGKLFCLTAVMLNTNKIIQPL